MRQPFRLIMGRNCIREVLKHSPERVVEVYTSLQPNEDALCAELVKQRIPIIQKSKKQLSILVESDSHQSFVAAVRERHQLGIKEFLENSVDRDRSLVLMLDSIYDPQNLGAILRAAECFGVDLVIYSKNRGTDITPTVTKTSAGATELISICKVSNLADTMQLFQKEGYKAVSTDLTERAESLYSFKFPEKTLIVMGSEHAGVQALLKKRCDFNVTIPMLGKVDSLNVSQATSIMLNGFHCYFSK